MLKVIQRKTYTLKDKAEKTVKTRRGGAAGGVTARHRVGPGGGGWGPSCSEWKVESIGSGGCVWKESAADTLEHQRVLKRSHF